jgi:tetratricopeptide (TPR) repeat protein
MRAVRPDSSVASLPRNDSCRTVRCLVAALLLSGACGARAADALGPARQREILREALHAFDQAVAVTREDPPRAGELYRQAAAGLLALRDAGVRNAALEYNLGNVYFRLGDLGRAILHYRRAQRLGGDDERLAANLRYARQRVEPRITPSGQTRLTQQLLFWHYDTSPKERFWVLVACAAVGWPLLFLWLRRRSRPLLVAGLIAIALGLAAGASLRWQLDDEVRHPHAVVVADQAYLRLGRGEGTDLALKQPLGAGVELRILQQRGDWVEVRLPNDQTGWLPAEAVERV